MNLRATGLLAALTLALAAFVYFIELSDDPPGPPAGLLFPLLSEESIESISVQQWDSPRARASRLAAGWRIVEPVSAPGDPVVLDRMARRLAELASGGRVTDPVELSVYGLDPAEARVALVHDGRELALELGRETPLGGQVYARVLAGTATPEIHMLALEAVLPLDVDVAEMRDARVLDFAPGDIGRLRIAARDGDRGFEATLERRDGSWSIAVPAPLEADGQAVGRLLSDLSLLRAEEFVDDPSASDLAALAAAELAIVLESEAGSQRLDLGAAVPDAPHLRLARGREDRLYRVRTALVEHFPKRLIELRDRRLLEFAAADVTALQIERAGGDLQRLESHPELVEALSRLVASEVVAEELGADELRALQLLPARTKLRLLGADDAVLAELKLGLADVERGVVAQGDRHDTVWRVDSPIEAMLAPDAIDKLLTDRARAALPEDDS